MKRIVLFVEGEGEADAVPRLVKRLLTEQKAWDVVRLDDNPFRVGSVHKLLKDNCQEWNRKLAACLKRRDVGGVLLLLDGDLERIGRDPFCSATVARLLACAAAATGGGVTFSVAVVFARQEFETWFIAGIGSLVGRQLPEDRMISGNVPTPDGNLEEAPRNAKGWLSQVIPGGYKPTRDQSSLCELIDLKMVRARDLRSFRRFESAVSELVTAIRTEKHVATPA